MYTKLSSLISSNIKLDNFSTAVKLAENGFYLYRGDEIFRNNLTLKNPKYRNSAYTTNVYTVLLSELLPSWKDYPKRNHCVICTNDENKANEYYDALYKVFPKNNTILGICPERDIWVSFKYASKIIFKQELRTVALNEFNEHFLTLIKNLIYQNNKNEANIQISYIEDCFDSNDIVKIKHIFNEIENRFLQNIYTEEYINFPRKWDDKYFSDLEERLLLYLANGIKNEHKTIISLLDEAFDPIKNGFKLVKIEDIDKENLSNNEIWFDAPCVMQR